VRSDEVADVATGATSDQLIAASEAAVLSDSQWLSTAEPPTPVCLTITALTLSHLITTSGQSNYGRPA